MISVKQSVGYTNKEADMAAFYGKKIITGAINPKTGQAWRIEDVPAYWRAATQEWIEEHTNG